MISYAYILFSFLSLLTAKRQESTAFVEQKSIGVGDAWLRAVVKHRILNVDEVDFTGDGVKDYICYSGYLKDNKAHEYWVDGAAKKIVKRRTHTDEVNEVRFAHLDEDSVPEIINAFGSGKRIFYAILRQNIVRKKHDTLLFFKPLMTRNHRYYKAYIRGFIDFYTKDKALPGQAIRMSATFKYTIKRKKRKNTDTVLFVKGQKRVPLILFEGQGEEELKKLKLKYFDWYTLSELIAASEQSGE